jgi:heptosyltransferase-2
MKPALSHGERVLVRAPSWLGDLVMAEPALRELHGRYGERLSIAGPGRLLELFDGRFTLARRIPTPEGGDRPEAWRGHGAAILLTGSFRSAWCAFRARIPVRAGWARDGRGWLLTHAPRPAREAGGTPLGLGRPGRWPRILPRPFGASCAELLGTLGIHVRDARPRLDPSPQALEAARARLASFGIAAGEPFVAVNVGARPGSAKGYPPELWAAVVERMHERRGPPAVLVCGPGEEHAIAATLSTLRLSKPHVWTKPAPSLHELLALISLASRLFTADTGPRHLAVATGTPVTVACGPTDPRHTADHLEQTLLLRTTVPCGPCHLEHCPLPPAIHHRCMRSLNWATFES